MTNRPTTIAVSDFLAAYGEVAPPATAALADLHVYADGTGDTVFQSKLDVLHTALAAVDEAARGLVPNTADRPQPQDGGGGKPPPPPAQ